MNPQTSKLFTPLKVGNIQLAHRVALAPLTRFRANKTHTHADMAVEYYAQRGTVPGTLLISEGTFIGARYSGYNNVPGIWSEDQIAVWKRVTDAVHARGSFIFLQLWALGRAAKPNILAAEDPSYKVTSPSALPLPGQEANLPTEMSISDIKEAIATYAEAASTAVHRAGFDGVEIHGANGYLVDQFLQEASNQRKDEYGGNLENRSRFGLEVVDAIAKEVGAERTGFRISPHGAMNGMGMKDPASTFGYFISELRKRQPNLAYLHAIDVRMDDTKASADDLPSLDFARELWKGKPFISAGGYSPESALLHAEKYDNEIVAFGRHFISNPDLPLRIREGMPLTPYDRSTFYTAESPKGYTDYPFASVPSIVEPAMA